MRMKTGLRNQNCIRWIAVVLALALLAGSVWTLWSGSSLEAQAAADTFPGVSEVRADIINQNETYYILEIVDKYTDAELGYYISGCEPYQNLWDDESHEYLSWSQKLNTYTSADERKAFMDDLKTQVEAAAATYSSSSPVAWSSTDAYTETGVDATTEGARTLTQEDSTTVYGYVDYYQKGHDSDSKNYWQATFERVENVSVDTVNEEYKSYPFYLAKPVSNTSYTYSGLKSAAEDDDTKDLWLCRKDPNHPDYYEYVGTASDVWSALKSDGSVTISDGDIVTASSEDATGYKNVSNDASGYYDVDFELLTSAITADCQYLYTETDTYAVDESGNPNGNCSLTEITSTSVDIPFSVHTIPTQTIYFTGYPTNTDAFRKQVLGLDDAECDSFPIRVYVMTPSDLNTYQTNGQLTDLLDQCSMVYMNTTGNGTDLSDATETALKSWIADEETPCLFDLDGVLSYDGSAYQAGSCGEKVGSLAAYLLASDKTKEYSQGTLSVFVASTEGQSDLAVDTTDHDCNFVRNNVWFFSSSNHPFVRASLQDNAYSDTLTASGADFGQVLEEIELENQYREADSGYTSDQRLSETVYDSTVWAYLINYSNSRAQIDKTSLRVLELEPATNADATFTNNSRQKLQDLTGVAMENITVVRMSMNEFIGHIEDLNETYDLIYIGGSTKGLNVDAATGLTNYNDNTMDGLLYSHVGDRVVTMQVLGGLLSNGAAQAEDARYSGNDLTVDKYNALVTFLNASYPVLVDAELVSSGAVNTDRVDNSSYLYEFLTAALDNTNVFVWDATNGLADTSQKESFDFYANRPKLSLVADSDYPNYILTTDKYNENVTQISADSDGHYYLTYRFRIENKGAADYSAKYTCKLYLDANADGKFSELNEELSGVTITDADGDTVSGDELETDEWYTVTRVVPDGYSGCLTWSLEVFQNTNSGVRASCTGYTRLYGLPATEIRILQIYYNEDKHIDLAELIGSWNGNSYVSDYSGLSNNYFYTYAEQAKGDYILDITSISKTVFENGVGDGTLVLDDYDMLILGFSDAAWWVDWDDTAVNGSSNSIRSFIESGKSVLFAHDMTSIVNVDTDNTSYSDGSHSYNWNYQMNTYIRDLVGMDLYGITSSNLNSSSPYAVLKNGNALTLSDGTYDGISAPSKSGDYYELGTKDVAFAPNTGRESTVAGVQGYTAAVLNQYMNNSVSPLTYREGMSFKNGYNAYSSSATPINDGQITNFPYVITADSDDNISIGETHGQYYTLDLDSDADSDGEADLVVWYTLSGGEYDKDYRDVSNNYYLYSKGNVIYTGMGHSAADLETDYANIGDVITESEAQLFINTMVAAYNAGVRKPEITVSDASGMETNTIYHYFDDLTDTAENVNVYFTIDDPNLLLGVKTETVRFYAEDEENGSGTLRYDTNDSSSGYIAQGIKLVDITDNLAGSVYVASTGAQVTDLTQLSPDVRYYVSVPASYFKSANGYATDLYITARTTITPTGGSADPTLTPWAGEQVQYVKVELFDLD